MQRIGHHIDGADADASQGDWLDDIEPATGRPWAQVADGTAADVDRAVDAARRAFPGWSATPVAERSRLLLALADRLEDQGASLAEVESTDTGKPLSVASNVDIPRSVANLRFFATAILHDSTEAHPMDRTALSFTLRRPCGVAALISPWNLPLYLLSWKVAPALATGNTVVAKPSELTPATARLLAHAARDVGFPDGVLNVVHGRGAIVGDALVRHPNVATISFTGGTVTGRAIATATAPDFKKLTLEMGGKNPTVVFEDADLERALPAAVRAAFSNQGEICLCGSRLLVQRSIHDAFVEELVERTRRLRLGDPRAATTDQGALISAEHRQRVLDHIESARSEGGRVQCGGRVPADLPQRCRDGFYLEPTVITGLGPACRANQQEIFGPVVTVQPFDDEADALRLANATSYGLAASVWTRDLARAHRMADEIESGIVWINCWMVRDLRVPFGGMKQSGLGREGGTEALRFFTEPKSVCIALPEREAP